MYAGGLIGSASRAHVSDCSADVTVTGKSTSGGFIGNMFQGHYKNCTAKGNVTESGQQEVLRAVYLKQMTVRK